MSGNTLVCPGSTHTYTVTRQCSIDGWFPQNGNVISTYSKSADVQWGTTGGSGKIIADLYSCTQNPPSISAWCDVVFIVTTSPSTINPTTMCTAPCSGSITMNFEVNGAAYASNYIYLITSGTATVNYSYGTPNKYVNITASSGFILRVTTTNASCGNTSTYKDFAINLY